MLTKAERIAKWRAENREHVAAYNAAYNARNRAKLIEKKRETRARPDEQEKIKEYSAAHYQKNAQRLREKSRKYREANRDKTLEASRKWRAENPDKQKKSCQSWLARNPEANRFHVQKRRARKRASAGVISRNILATLMLAQGAKCVYCSTDIASSYQIDHKTPLARGGLHVDANMQLLCPTCNMRKHAKTHAEFLAVTCR